jgi:hypothetical protein
VKNNAMAISVRTRIICGARAIMTIILSIGENPIAQTKINGSCEENHDRPRRLRGWVRHDLKMAGRGDPYESCARPSEMTLRLRSGLVKSRSTARE